MGLVGRSRTIPAQGAQRIFSEGVRPARGIGTFDPPCSYTRHGAFTSPPERSSGYGVNMRRAREILALLLFPASATACGDVRPVATETAMASETSVADPAEAERRQSASQSISDQGSESQTPSARLPGPIPDSEITPSGAVKLTLPSPVQHRILATLAEDGTIRTNCAQLDTTIVRQSANSATVGDSPGVPSTETPQQVTAPE